MERFVFDLLLSSLFLFRIYQGFEGWALTKTDFITAPSLIFLEGVAISPNHHLSLTCSSSHFPGNCE